MRPTWDAPASTAAERSAAAGTVLHLPAGSVLLVAGIPGAGKSTLIHRIFGRRTVDAADHAADAVVLDSADVRAAIARRLGPRVPYRLYRPVVHSLHYARIAAWTLGPHRNLVVHECGTRDWARRTMAVLATLRRRPAHLLFLDTPPELAIAGQRSRGRLVRSRSFHRHIRHWARLRDAVDAIAAAEPEPRPEPEPEPRPEQAGAGRPAPPRTAVLRTGALHARVRVVGCLAGAPTDLWGEGWASARRLTREEASGISAIRFDG